MFIQTESTPNPATMKFLPECAVLPSGTADFTSVEAAKNSPLAMTLFQVQGVKAVFFGTDFVTVTKDDKSDWVVLKPLVLASLMEHLSQNKPVMLDGAVAATAEASDEISAQIIELIETRVRPAVAMDGGDITFDRFEDGIVYLQLRGSCAGCPSSTLTLKSGIENMLKHYVPEVVEVRAVL